STFMPQFDRVAIGVGPDGVQSVDASAEHAVDPAFLQASLADAFPGASISVGPAVSSPEQGAMRINPTSGLRQQFSGLAWLPAFNFEPTLERCQLEVNQAIDEGEVNFLTGSAELSPQSMRTINGLSGLITHCLATNPGFRLQIGGHTDNRGSADMNQRLSETRAFSVLQALADRGVPGPAMTAIGFGEDQPIASNDTDDGRAANRRTTIIWTN
ncbi:MAG: OmpA family protein, partial [Shimia sp.]